MSHTAFRVLIIAATAAGAAACATPRYAASLPGSEGSHTRPPIDDGLHGTMKPYQVKGVWYSPHAQPGYDKTGIASWYGYESPSRTTADGEIFDTDLPSAAHKTLPLPSLVEVTNLDNGKKIIVRVNDRGPFVDGRIIDLTRAAAQQLGYADQGTARVRVRYVGPAGDAPLPRRQVAASAPRRDYTIDERTLPPPPPPPTAVELSRPPAALAAQGPIWRVQAAAFSSRANADRAASFFGSAHVEPLEHGDATLWRVILGPARNAQDAAALREQAAAAGFADAKVLGPF